MKMRIFQSSSASWHAYKSTHYKALVRWHPRLTDYLSSSQLLKSCSCSGLHLLRVSGGKYHIWACCRFYVTRSLSLIYTHTVTGKWKRIIDYVISLSLVHTHIHSLFILHTHTHTHVISLSNWKWKRIIDCNISHSLTHMHAHSLTLSLLSLSLTHTHRV